MSLLIASVSRQDLISILTCDPSSHYVAFIRKEIDGKPSWVLFNDEKVAVGVDAEEMTKAAYIYFFKHA